MRHTVAVLVPACGVWGLGPTTGRRPKARSRADTLAVAAGDRESRARGLFLAAGGTDAAIARSRLKPRGSGLRHTGVAKGVSPVDESCVGDDGGVRRGGVTIPSRQAEAGPCPLP